MRQIILLVGVGLLSAGCTVGAAAFSYCNPNEQLKMRDTHIIPNPDDGKFYAVGTLFWGYEDPDGNAGFRLYVSDNLKDWEPGPWIMKRFGKPATIRPR